MKNLVPSHETRKLVVRRAGTSLLLAERLEAKKEAERIVGAARQEGKRLVEEARRESALIRRRAERDGKQEGDRKVARRVAEAFRWGREARKKFKVEMAEMAAEIAARILRRELIMAGLLKREAGRYWRPAGDEKGAAEPAAKGSDSGQSAPDADPGPPART